MPRNPLLLLLAVSSLAACETDPGPLCSLPPLASVEVSLTSAGGDPIVDATVTYQHELGDETPCLQDQDSNRWLCGDDLAGDFLIHVAADGFRPLEDSATVVEAGCTISPDFLELVLARTTFPEARSFAHFPYGDGPCPGFECVETVDFCPDGTALRYSEHALEPMEGTYALTDSGIGISFDPGTGMPPQALEWDGDDLVDAETSALWEPHDGPAFCP